LIGVRASHLVCVFVPAGPAPKATSVAGSAVARA